MSSHLFYNCVMMTGSLVAVCGPGSGQVLPESALCRSLLSAVTASEYDLEHILCWCFGQSSHRGRGDDAGPGGAGAGGVMGYVK